MNVEATLQSFEGLTEVPDDVATILGDFAAWRKLLPAFRPQTLVRSVLAAIAVSPPNLAVFSSVCEATLARDLCEFDPGDLTMLSWAVAVANQSKQSEAVLVAVGGQLAQRAWEFSADELAKTVRAFAELRLQHHDMLTAVSFETMWKIDSFRPHSLSQMAESLALLEFCKEPTFKWLGARVLGRLQDYRPDELSTVVWSFAKASIKHEELTKAVSEEMVKWGDQITEDDFRRNAWAFSELCAPARGAMQPLYNPQFNPQFNPQLFEDVGH